MCGKSPFYESNESVAKTKAADIKPWVIETAEIESARLNTDNGFVNNVLAIVNQHANEKEEYFVSNYLCNMQGHSTKDPNDVFEEQDTLLVIGYYLENFGNSAAEVYQKMLDKELSLTGREAYPQEVAAGLILDNFKTILI